MVQRKKKTTMDRINKVRVVTRGIKHWGLGGYLNFLPRIKFGVTGQESSPQSPTISYRHRWAQVCLMTRKNIIEKLTLESGFNFLVIPGKVKT